MGVVGEPKVAHFFRLPSEIQNPGGKTGWGYGGSGWTCVGGGWACGVEACLNPLLHNKLQLLRLVAIDLVLDNL